MAEFKITRFKYTWLGNWQDGSNLYYKDDVVYYQGSTWVCIRQHSSSVFVEDQEYIAPGDTLPSPAWVKMVDSREWSGDWIPNGTRYDPGVLTLIGGNVYICITSHLSSSQFNTDLTNWELFAAGSNFRNTWQPTNRYRTGDIIRYNGYTYQCILEHDSSTIYDGVQVGNNNNDDDSTAETWKVVVENYIYVGVFSAGVTYRINDLVKYGGSVFKCISEHTSSSTFDSSSFTTYLPGYEFLDSWSSSNYYAVGDVVRVGGDLYIAVVNNHNSEPGSTIANQTFNSNWSLIDKARNYVGLYDFYAGVYYKEGDLVRRGGALWVSLVDQVTDDSSLTSLDLSNWEPVIPSQNYRGSWKPQQYYNLYDLVYFNGILYSATYPHVSEFNTFPGDNGEGFEYWSIVVIGDVNAALSTPGDMLTFNLKRNIITVDGQTYDLNDESTLGTTPIPIGEPDQLLTPTDNLGTLDYAVWGRLERVFFVRNDGVDDAADVERGQNYFKPYKTLRFALEQANDGFTGTTTIKVATGIYEEILPLIVPARTAIVGEELRSVTIKANEPIQGLSIDTTYTLSALIRIGLIIEDIIEGNSVSATIGNTTSQDNSVNATPTTSAVVGTLWANIIEMIDYRVNSNGTSPTVSGSNTLSGNQDRANAAQNLENNRDFIKAEVVAHMQYSHPLYSFNQEKCLRDIDKFIDAIKLDLSRAGNYNTVLAARYYANAVTGSGLEDMFYVRDATGLRNLSLTGLNGTLPPLQEGDIYRIPTGGAYVSLDPGWGPDDERCWITTRSCYVQNCTTFGTGAVGQKIDGLLHNGGLRSIVSNDFTQVISDGIGAWVQNGGRAELVSVFTYYSHIGMFAKDGGIIRATNGNSSYGDFGALADGINPDEVPKYATLNTTTEQAQVVSAFAGEVLDYILGLEFSNCGQNYTTATYTISSSGSGAVAIHEETKDDSMFECQILTNGLGFKQFGNQAQIGDEYSITLATSETVEESEILGMRVVIISGEGTGQYGYVYSYNPTTKICVVYRESDDNPGWDHINPGTPSNPLLTTGTRYRIEPRPIFSKPEFITHEITLSTPRAWTAAVYGETSATYEVTVVDGTGTVDPELVHVQAVFTVEKTGRTYDISVLSGGAGYNAGDVILIDGSDVGGISGEHDIRMEVLTTTEDSTNSILTFKLTDDTIVADSGKFVITPILGNTGLYSSDGENWAEFTLPSSGTWHALAAGNNMFVAIKYGSTNVATSTDGVTWTSRSISNRNWIGVAYGKPSTTDTGVFVAISENLNASAYSIDGVSWTNVTLPTVGDSTLNDWSDIAFGANVFVAIATSGNVAAVGTWNGTTLTWESTVIDVIADSTRKNWVSIAYGNRRFVAISDTGEAGWSFDGITWYPQSNNNQVLPHADDSTEHNWKQIRYGQGVFFAVGDTGGRIVGADETTGPTTFAATSYDGVIWEKRELTSLEDWGVIAFGNPDITLGDSTMSKSKGMWIAAPTTVSDVINKIYTGARAIGRVVVSGQGISSIKIWEPGSGYLSDSDITLTIVDPNSTEAPTYRTRIADRVLSQPKFVQRGYSYKTSTTSVTISGDGYADITPRTKYITIDGLTRTPRSGAQFYIGGRTRYFTAVAVGIDEVNLPNGTIRSTFQISPVPKLSEYLENGMEVLIREKYSQVRITGHDFLDVGTGNFISTNYPHLYDNYDYVTTPDNEVYEMSGGRVFYTSTDQNGNFRAGSLFAVEQATGYITISADFFDLSGLTELRLAGVNVGSTATVREFSKDPLFLQNSNYVIPTQRAIRAYLNSRLNIGGEDLLTPNFIAGTVRVGPNLINNTAGLAVDIPVVADFSGNGAGIRGSMLANAMFYRSFRPAK